MSMGTVTIYLYIYLFVWYMSCLFIPGSFGIGITLISDGQERLDLDVIEKKCNTQIFLLPGKDCY